jgi:hypothetical protein
MRQHWPDQFEDEGGFPLVGAGCAVLVVAAIVGLIVLLWRQLRRR